MVLVGATGRNAGKTTAAAFLVAFLSRFRTVEALKVTTADHSGGAVCHRGGGGCGACAFNGPYRLEEERDAASAKDTSRLLAAGARRVFWLRATRRTLPEGLLAYLAMVPADRLIVAESNSLRGAARPGFFLLMSDPLAESKPSAKRVSHLADLVVEAGTDISEERAAMIMTRLTVPGPAQTSRIEAAQPSRPLIRPVPLESPSLEAALELLLARHDSLSGTEILPLERALGRVNAAYVRAAIDNPPFDRSAMDGFALNHADTLGATEAEPARLSVGGVLYAGDVLGRRLAKGEAVRIMTGAAMPPGADCMLPKEIVRDEGAQVAVFRPAARHENYIFRAEDIRRGELFLEPGDRLDAARLAMLASMGLAEATVYRSPAIGIFCVGDEFSPPGAPLAPGKIYNSNGPMLWARLTELGFSPAPPRILPDDPEAAAAILVSASPSLDVVITAGSVSVGDKDIMARVFGLLDVERDISRLAFKPGSAFLCGRWASRPFFCLSGNPFAALATFELVARPVLAKLSRMPHLHPRRVKAALGAPFDQKQGARQRRFLRARLADPPSGGPPVVLLPDGHSSGRVFSMAGCNCLVDLEPGLKTLAVGATVDAVRLD
jgi:molybdopterin molybdotransferase